MLPQRLVSLSLCSKGFAAAAAAGGARRWNDGGTHNLLALLPQRLIQLVHLPIDTVGR